MAVPELNKIIYSMIGVSRFYDKKPVLKDIYLSYFYGAKIGVLGLNGSGKSSLLRILAGVDKEFVGQTVLAPGDGNWVDATGADAAVDADVHDAVAGRCPIGLAHGDRDRSPSALGHANPILQVPRLTAEDTPQFRPELTPELKPIGISQRV